jgi:hypothetical protein
MNKQKTQKKKNNTLRYKNLVGGYGIKTKSNRNQTNARTRKLRRKMNNRMLREEGELEEGDNQEDYAYPPVPPYSQPEIPPIPPYVPPTPYGDVQSYVPPPAFEPIPAYVPTPTFEPIQPYVPPPAFGPIPPFQNSTSSEEQITSPVIPQEEPVINTVIPQEEPVINPVIPQEEPVTNQISPFQPYIPPPAFGPIPPSGPTPAFEPIPEYVQPSEIPPVKPYEQPPAFEPIPPSGPTPAFEPIPAYVQPSEIPTVPPYVPPPAFAPIPPFQNSTSSKEPPEEPVINQEPESETNAEEFKNGFTETIIPNNQPPTNNNINVELCPTIIEVGKNINHKYMFPSQFPVITNFYKQIPENMIKNTKNI